LGQALRRDDDERPATLSQSAILTPMGRRPTTHAFALTAQTRPSKYLFSVEKTPLKVRSPYSVRML
jgi:hypothetical protein